MSGDAGEPACCPDREGKGLAQMFLEADHAIKRRRAGNIFRQLDERTLTIEEEEIIQQRVEMQRRLFEEYEKREKTRKVQELVQLCSGITAAAAERALVICHGKEDDAAMRLTSEDNFRRRVMAGTGSMPTGAVPGAPKIISPSKLSGQVFVGRFRSKLGPYQVNAPTAAPSHRSRGISREPEPMAPASSAEMVAAQGTVGATESTDCERDESDQGAACGASDVRAETQFTNGREEHTCGAATCGAASDGGGISGCWDGGSDSDTAAARPLVADNAPLPQRLAMFKARQLALQDVLVGVEAMRVLEAAHAGAVEQVLRLLEGTSADKAAQLRTAWEVVLAMEEADFGAIAPAQQPADRAIDSAGLGPTSRCPTLSAAPAVAPAPTGCNEQFEQHSTGDAAELNAAGAPSAAHASHPDHIQPAQLLAGHEPPPPHQAQQTCTSGGVSAAHDTGQGDSCIGCEQQVSGALTEALPAHSLTACEAVASDSGSVRMRRSARVKAAAGGTSGFAPGGNTVPAGATRPSRNGAGAARASSPQPVGTSSKAISSTGHTCRGRVKQKSHKRAEVVELGTLHVGKGWYNAGYIFPLGFRSRVLFRSSVDLDALCVHECTIVGEGGMHWPAPTFMVTAADRPGEPVCAKSCTGCWSGILKRINAVITARIATGAALPPPPRTAIAGPEYFGLNDEAIVGAIEGLDPRRLCTAYWDGKEDREMAIAGAAPAPQEQRTAKPPPAALRGGAGSGAGKRRCRGARGSADGGGASDDEDTAAGYRGSRWSTISRTERYRKRCVDSGGTDAVGEAEMPLLPGYLDPITLEPVATPTISPAGHVMGLATWKAVLAEQQRCPFTKQPLRVDQLTVLTHLNIERFKDKIVQQ